MSNYKKLGKDVLLMTIGSFGSKLLTFVFVGFYTGMLSTEEYGPADLISTTIMLLFPFFSAIICEAMMRFALEKENDPKQVWSIGIKVTIIGSAVFMVLSPIVFLTPLKDYYIFVVLYYITYAFNHAVSYFVRGINKTKIFALGGIVQTFAVIVSSLTLLLWLKLGILGYLISHVIGSVVSTVYMYLFAKVHKYGFTWKNTDKAMQKQMLKYSIPMIPNSVSWWLSDTASKFFLTMFIGTSATGLFSVANKIPHIMTTMTGIFGRAWKINAVDDFGSEKSKKFYEDCFSKMAAMLLLFISVMLLMNKPLALILFKKEFFKARQFVPILLFSTIMHAYSEFLGSIYTSSYKTNFLIVSTSIGAAINVLMNIILIPRVGIMGAAISVATAQTVICISRLIHSRSILKLKYHWQRDGMCYFIIATQIFVAIKEFSFAYIYSAAAVVLIAIVLHRELKGMFRMVANGLIRKKR